MRRLLLIFALCLLVPACTSFQLTTVQFQPIAAPGGQAFLLAGPGGGQQNSLALELNAQGIAAPVYGIAADLDFDPNVLRFDGFDRGVFFESGGEVSYQVKTAPGNLGKLIIGVSLLGVRPGVTGSGLVLRLRFTILEGTGSSVLTFTNAFAVAANGQPIPTVAFAGGQVSTSAQ